MIKITTDEPDIWGHYLNLTNFTTTIDPFEIIILGLPFSKIEVFDENGQIIETFT